MLKKKIILNTKFTVAMIFVTLMTLLMLYPFAWMLTSSVKYDFEVFSIPMRWWPEHFVWQNYSGIFERMPYATFIINTFKLAVCITILQIITSSFAAYGFAKLRFPGRSALFIIYICTIAVPWQTYMIPQYLMMGRVGLVNTHLGLIILRTFSAFGVFLMRQFYLGIPMELSEAARIDGLSEYGIYLRIILPLSKPALATLTVFTFTAIWNDYMGPLIYLTSNNKLNIQIGLRSLVAMYSAEYGLLMAGSVLALIPVFLLFLSLQRYFVEGVATSGLKG
jgi:multiple sugar transport system permease protein